MHAGARASAVMATGRLDVEATAGVATVEPLSKPGRACSRVASFIAATLQQEARSSAVARFSPLFAQQECEGSEAQQSAAKAGRIADTMIALTAMAAATRRIGGILLGPCFAGNSFKKARNPERPSVRPRRA